MKIMDKLRANGPHEMCPLKRKFNCDGEILTLYLSDFIQVEMKNYTYLYMTGRTMRRNERHFIVEFFWPGKPPDWDQVMGYDVRVHEVDDSLALLHQTIKPSFN